MDHVPSSTSRNIDYLTLYGRGALAAAFLSAVTDRLGVWGPNGAPNVAWGDMSHFLAYTAKLNPWFPASVIPILAVVVTIIETTLGLAFLTGFRVRAAATLSGCLIFLFGVGMTAGTGFKSALNASVFAASASGFLLARAPHFPFSVDAFREGPPKA
jgi:thiosulfate dehydrogenase [quinone] large subunit